MSRCEEPERQRRRLEPRSPAGTRGQARPGRAPGASKLQLSRGRLSQYRSEYSDPEATRAVTTKNSTVTDISPPRSIAAVPVLKQVLPLPEGFASGAGTELPRWVIEREIPIGRDADPDQGICLAEDSKVSKRHALLRRRGDVVEITDVGSKNHTFVDGHQITTVPLQDGAVVRIGNTLFVMRMERQGVSDAPRSERALLNRLLGQSQEVRELRHNLSLAARSADTVLLSGPSGTGKELGATALHALSPRSGRTLVTVNCAAIPQGGAESALFGHKRGAFTSAERDHDGYFKQADSGTLFLDEVGELPLDIQAKLLRALQPAPAGPSAPAGQNILRIQPYGGHSEVKVDVRVIAATNVDLERAVSAGRFRRDLFQRLCVLPVSFPPLSKRRDDIAAILYHYLNQERAGGGGPLRCVSARMGELLLLYRWPGNVRELENLSKRLRTLASTTDVIDLDMLPDDLFAQLVSSEEPSESMPDEPADDSPKKEPITRELLTRLLAENEGLISRVARILGRSPKQIRRRMDQFKIPRPSAQAGAASAKDGTVSPDEDGEDDDEGGESG